MKRVKMIVAYDGTNYCGWQIQNNGITIEEVLNRTLTDLLKEPITVTGASRTDSECIRREMWQCLIQKTECLQTRSVLL